MARAIETTGNSMQKDLLYSNVNSAFLMITLRNGLVYVGVAIELDEPEGQSYIRILPVYLGYRDQQFRVVFVTDYLAPGNIERQTGTVTCEEDIITTTLYEDEELNQIIEVSPIPKFDS